jgi:hypothetical protein
MSSGTPLAPALPASASIESHLSDLPEPQASQKRKACGIFVSAATGPEKDRVAAFHFGMGDESE